LLLEEVLNKKRWSAARDIVLFIRETLADELDNGEFNNCSTCVKEPF
jgi:hypothetical protein